MSDSCIVPPPITDPKELDEREPDPAGLELVELQVSDPTEVRIAEMKPISERLIRDHQGESWLVLYLILPLAIGMVIGSILVLISMHFWQEPDRQMDRSSQETEGVS